MFTITPQIKQIIVLLSTWAIILMLAKWQLSFIKDNFKDRASRYFWFNLKIALCTTTTTSLIIVSLSIFSPTLNWPLIGLLVFNYVLENVIISKMCNNEKEAIALRDADQRLEQAQKEQDERKDREFKHFLSNISSCMRKDS